MHRRPRLTPGRRTLGTWAGATAVGVSTLVACGGPVDPAADPTTPPLGDSPACTTALAAAPATVLDAGRVAAGAPVPGVAVWGSPGIVLRCGLPALGPTTLPCLTVDDVDWVLDDPGVGSQDPVRFVSFGRTPALEVLVPAAYDRQNAAGALVDLAPVAAALPVDRRCVGLGDSG